MTRSSTRVNPLEGRIPDRPERRIFSLPDRNVWCASPIGDRSGRFHLFYSNWAKAEGHEAWVTHSVISRAESESPLGPWKDCGPVFPDASSSGEWDSGMSHNPHVVEVAGRYFLYYTATRRNGFRCGTTERSTMAHPEWWRSRNTQRVGVAWAEHPAGPWHRLKKPLMAPPPGFRLSATPSVLARPDGRIQLIFKAVEENGTMKGGVVRHFVGLGEHPLGPFQILTEPILAGVEAAFPIDDHYEWFQDGHYWCLAKDHDGGLVAANPCLFLMHSSDGIGWQPFSPTFIIPFDLTWSDSRRMRFDRLEMPKMLFAGGRPAILFLAAKPAGSEDSFNIQIPLLD